MPRWRYQVAKSLGPEVDLVTDRLTGRWCVEKRAEGPLEREALGRELTLLTESRHPALRRALAADGAWPPRRLTLAFVDGDDLASATGSDVESTRRVLADVLGGLQYLHDQGLAHGDLKPSHILVDRAGHGRLIDLGLVLPIGAPIRGGTPRFMPPEYLAGGVASAVGDLYAFGSAAAEMQLAVDDGTAELLRACRAADPRARPSSAIACISALGQQRRRLDVLGTFPRTGESDVFATSLEAIRRARGECILVSAERGSGMQRFTDDLAGRCARDGLATLAFDPQREPEWIRRAAEATGHHLTGELERDAAAVATRLVRRGTALIVVSYDAGTASLVRTLGAAVTRAKRGALVALGPFARLAGDELGLQVVSLPGATAAEAAALCAVAGVRVDPEQVAELTARTEGRIGCIARTARIMSAGAGLAEALIEANEVAARVDEVPLPSDPVETARELLAQGRDTEVADLLTRAFADITEHPGTHPEAASILARALYRRSATSEAAKLVAKLGDHASSSDRMVAARSLERLGDYRGAYAAALALTTDGDSGIALEAHAIAAHTSLALGAPEKASRHAEEGLRLLAAPELIRSDAPSIEGITGRLHTARSDAALRKGEAAIAVDYATAALAHAQQRSDDELMAHALVRLGAAHALSGQPSAAIDHYTRALEHADRAGDVAALPAFIANLATAEHATGRFSAAIEHYQEAAALALRFGRRANWLGAVTNLAGLWIFTGADVEAQQLIEQARPVARATGASFYIAQLLLLEAELVARTAPRRAAKMALEASDAFASIGAERQALEARLCHAEAALGDGQVHAALSFVAETRVELAAAGLDGRAKILQARGFASLGAHDKSLSSGRAAETLARASSDRSLEARAIFQQALALEAKAPGTGSPLFARAGETLEELARGLPHGLRERFVETPEHAPIRRFIPGPRAFVPAPVERALSPQSRQLINLVRRVLREGQESRVLEGAIDDAVALSGAERAFLVLVKPKGPPEVAVARNLDRETLRRPKFRYSRSVANRVIRTGELVITASASDDPDFDSSRSVLDLGLRSILCVPIRGPSGTLGAIYLDHRFERDRFSDDKPELVTAIADIVGLALENARLFAKAEERAHVLEQQNERIALESARRAAEVERLTAALAYSGELPHNHQGILGRSNKIRRALDIAKRVAPSDLPVLVVGETGTGKELFARYIHETSLRSAGPFVAINCGAVPETLLESELFGHKRGAFTGATRDHAGLFRDADRGTLLLDEIGEMPLRMQTRLLRVLQEGEVRPVGGDTTVTVDVRIVAATHRDLEEGVRQKTFREDLYYRLMGVSLVLPPLRERKEDIPDIANAILAKLEASHGRPFTLSRGVLDALLRHDWPGNVRELEQALRRAAMLSTGPALDPESLQLRAAVESRKVQVQHSDRAIIERALLSAGGNRTAAAAALNVSRVTLYRWIKRYGLAEKQRRSR